MFSLLFLEEKVCLFCKNWKEKGTGYVCEDCYRLLEYAREEYYIDGFLTYSIFKYNNFLREYLMKYKYHNNPYYYRAFSEIVVEDLKKCDFLEGVDYIFPIPLYFKKERRRGFNQATLIAKEIGKVFNIPVSEELKKVKDSKQQHLLSRVERAENVFETMELKNGEKYAGKSVLVFDDVTTTGATLKEAVREFRKCGVQSVKSMTIAK